MFRLGWFKRWFAPISFGEQGEREACRFLKRLGYKIIFTRHRQRYGEVDIIAVDSKVNGSNLNGPTVVFIEVKTRRSAAQGRPAEAVDATRQARLTRAALAFLKSHGLLGYASRFDVMEVLWPQEQKRPEITHLQDAFPAVGSKQFYS